MAVVVAVLIAGLVGGVYLSRKSYVPVLSELSAEINQKNAEIRALQKKEQEMEKKPLMYVVENGKVYPVGSDSAVLSEIELETGEVLRINGVILRNNGTTLRLMNGDVVSTDGVIKLSTQSAN